MWCIPPAANADFVYHMEDVVAVYHRPADPQHPVVCMDEATKQLGGEVREPLPARPGEVERCDGEYVRNGTTTLFIAVDPLAGWRDVTVTDHRCRTDWAHLVKAMLDGRYRDAAKVTLVMDHLNTHSPASFYEAFDPAEAKRLTDKLEIHYTPKHGSWLNIAEIELSALSRQCLDRRIADAESLKREVETWTAGRNDAKTHVRWRFTTADARIKLHRLYPSVEL
jgi:hypothetical protein